MIAWKPTAGSLPLGCLLAATLWCAPLRVEASHPRLGGPTDAVLAILESRADLGDSRAADRLTDLGAQASAPVVRLLLTPPEDSEEEELQGLSFDERRFLLNQLRELPLPGVLAEVNAWIDSELSLDRRLIVIEVLAATEQAGALEPTIEVYLGLPDELAQQSVSRRALKSALLQFLNADPALCDPLATLALEETAPVGLTLTAIEALGELGAMASVPALEQALEQRPIWTTEALEALGILKPFLVDDRIERALEIGEEHLTAADPKHRRAAVQLVAALGEFEHLESLIERLDDEDSRVRSAVDRALTQHTGRRQRQSQDDWFDWIDSEHRWLEERQFDLLEALEQGTTGAAAAALRELGEHPWHRASTTALLQAGTDREEQHLALHACLLLADAGGPQAGEVLLELLRDGREGIRGAAYEALQGMTHHDLPPDYFLWQERLRR